MYSPADRPSSTRAAAAKNRTSLCYILGQTFLFGGLLGFITSAQQVFADALHASAQLWTWHDVAACMPRAVTT